MDVLIPSCAVFGARYVLAEDSHVPRGPFPPGLPILVKVDRWKESLVEISMRSPSSRFQVVDFCPWLSMVGRPEIRNLT